MRRKIAIAAVMGALAITGTALAAGGGHLGGPFGDDRTQELAKDLAGELDGVNAGEVEQALESVREQQMAERRGEMAAGIAAQLDGVSAEQVSAALAKHEEQVRDSITKGERPDFGSLVTTLSEELGKSEDQISSALEAAREAGTEEHRAEALERLDQAVEDGEVSTEQADQIRERIENGPDSGHAEDGERGGPGFGPGGPGV